MATQNTVKVFKAGSKQADFSVMHPFAGAVVRTLSKQLDDEAGRKAEAAFKVLSDCQAESLVFRHNGRKIKVEAAGRA